MSTSRTAAVATPTRRRASWGRRLGLGLVGLSAVLGLLRTAAFLDDAVHRLPTPYDAYHLESKMVHLAWRVQHGVSLYPQWTNGPYVSNFFGPGYFVLVGWIGRVRDASLEELYRIGRWVCLASSVLSVVVVAWAAWRRGGPAGAAVAASLATGSGPMFGFATMTRPDAVADFLGFAGFLLVVERSLWARGVGGLVLILAILTKQTTVIYLGAAVLALAATNRWRAAAQLAAVAAVAVAAIVGGVTLALEPEFARSLVGEAGTRWDRPAWLHLLGRFRTICPDLIVFTAIGVGLWLARPWRDLPLAVLAVVLATGSTLAAGKLGADLNYFLGLRYVAPLAAASLCEALRRAEGLRAWGLAVLAVVGLVSLYPSLLHAASQAQNSRKLAAVGRTSLGEQYLREHQALYRLAADPGVRLITDSGLLDIRRGARTVFGDPWLFRVMVESGRIDPRPLVEQIEAEDFDRIVTTKPLEDPSYTTYDFGMPMPMVEAARRHARFLGTQAGLFIYQPLNSASD